MGYDMYWVNEPDGQKEKLAKAQAEFDALVTVRDSLPEREAGVFDQVAYKAAGKSADWEDDKFYPGRTDRFTEAQNRVTAAYERLFEVHESYFRLNVFGMAKIHRVMDKAGITFDDYDVPRFPRVGDFGITREDVEAVQENEAGSMPAATNDAVGRFLKEQERVRQYHGKADVPGIPSHKFGTNDGWHVLPAECEAAVRLNQQWRDLVGEDAAINFAENAIGERGWSLWNRWVSWVGQAARYGGFTVH